MQGAEGRTRQRIIDLLRRYCGDEIADTAHIPYVSGKPGEVLWVRRQARNVARVVWEFPDWPVFSFFGARAVEWQRKQAEYRLQLCEESLEDGSAETRWTPDARPALPEFAVHGSRPERWRG